METKATLVLVGAGALLGGIAVYKLMPPKIEVQEKEVVKDRIVTVTHEVKAPDGTVVTDTTTTQVTKSVSETKKSEPLAAGAARGNWLVQGGMGANSVNRMYMLGVHRQVLGPVYLGVQVQRAAVQGDSILGVITVSF